MQEKNSYFNVEKVKIDSIVLPTLEHELKIVTVDPDCLAAGSETINCKNCDYSVVNQIPALKHDWNLEKATCTEDKFCRTCGDIGEKAKNHNYEVKSTPATCEKEGFDVYTCSACGDSYQEIMIKTRTKGFSELIRRRFVIGFL